MNARVGDPTNGYDRQRARFIISVVLIVGVLVLYLIRPDAAQAIHWWPMGIWTPVVLLPFSTLRPRRLLRPLVGAFFLWVVALQIVGEPSWRVFQSPGGKDPAAFRIVSLNCAGGTAAAAQEAFAQSADLILLQEVGSREEFERAARQAGYPYGSWSFDDAVFSKRPLTDVAHGPDFAAGSVTLQGQKLKIVALRLLPPVFRLDLWNPGCWQEYAQDTAARRRRMQALLPRGPAIVGGDFNATNPRLVQDHRPEMNEAGRTVGRGWRGTGTNDFPLVWTDQIWASPEVRWKGAYVAKTGHSDHRMVIAEFRLD